MGINVVEGKKQDNASWSEFGPSSDKIEFVVRYGESSAYDRSVVTETIKRLLSEDIVLFSSLDSKRGFKLNIPSDIVAQDDVVDVLSEIKYIDCEDGFLVVDDFINRFVLLSYSLKDDIMYFSDIDASISVLDAFFDLSKKVVFNYQSELLHNMSFRKSRFLKELILFGAHEVEWFNDKTDDNDVANYIAEKNNSIISYNFGFKNPFVIDSFRRIINNVKAFNIRNAESSLLTMLKREILLRRAERSFNRFLRADNKTHRVSLNRHTSSLTSWPYYELSSIEEIKPIRLFEKIVTYINNNIDFSISEYCVNISIIGHTEVSNNGKEKELADLMTAILSWYDQFSIGKQIETKLSINIVNYVNQKDWPNYNFERIKNFKCESKRGKAQCSIRLVDYSSFFALSLFEMSKIIDKNNIVFILDCPWLTSENVDIKMKSSLDYFCKAIKDVSLEDGYDLEDYSYDNPERLDSPYHTMMKYLDSQYNRIMASSTINAGSIVRVLKDKVIKKIQRMVSQSDYNVKKELFVFSSENDGLDYSYLASYPLTRMEMYEGKRISIFQFCNYEPTILEYNDPDNLVFNIRFWSMLKYISIAYAYIDFKKIIDKCFDGIQLNAEHYFTIYRNIYVSLLIDIAMTNIVISIKLDKSINNIFDGLCDETRAKNCLRELIGQIGILVKDIYSEVVFSPKDEFGNNAIREAFSMNIYSCVSDVNEVMFWHKYRMAVLNNDFEGFNVNYSFDKTLSFIDTIDYDKELFMDKRIYDLVLLSLETQNGFAPVIKAMLYSCDGIFGANDMVQKIVQNIANACDKIGVVADELKWNAINSLEELF